MLWRIGVKAIATHLQNMGNVSILQVNIMAGHHDDVTLDQHIL